MKSLQDIFNDDDFNLLEVKPAVSAAQHADARLLESFATVVDFYRTHQREPNPQNGMTERMLFSRLVGLREDADKVAALLPHDEYGLLGAGVAPPKVLNSLSDIFEDDFDFTDDGDLFNLKHVSLSDLQRAESDFVARRAPCKNFDDYELLFQTVQKDLLNGQRKLLPYTDSNLQVGRFYVNNGMLLLLERIEFDKENITLDTGKRQRKDGRTRCVFENGTESNMLFRSLSKILYANGQLVSHHSDTIDSDFSKAFSLIDADDKPTGYIYVLKSNSTDVNIQNIQNLFKIGYSTTDVASRILNASDEPTYLMADVTTLAVYDCYNLNPQKFEQLLHNFFGAACLELKIIDKKGQQHAPREWFVVPFNRIEQVIELIISGEIVNYRYDVELEELILK